jgi:hypothetical protein
VNFNPMPYRRVAVEIPVAGAFMGRIEYPSITNEQDAELQELGRKIQGSSPQCVGVASIVAFAHGDRQYIPPAQLALIDAYVAAETAAGRQPSSWLLNAQINRAGLG